MKKCLLLLTTALAVELSAQVAVINFDDLTAGNAAPIPDGYGSTPEVAVSYRSFDDTGPSIILFNQMSFWTTGYGDLQNVAYQTTQGGIGEIALTPQAGWRLTLNSFDMAAYSNPGTLHEEVISILHDGTSLELGPAEITGITHDHFSPAVTSDGPILIRIGREFNNGIDNINFTVAPVPEPSTYATVSATLLLAGAIIRRFRRTRAGV